MHTTQPSTNDSHHSSLPLPQQMPHFEPTHKNAASVALPSPLHATPTEQLTAGSSLPVLFACGHCVMIASVNVKQMHQAA
jgi:hypothetical protein